MKKFILAATVFVLPAVAFAQGSPELGNITTLVTQVRRIIDILIPLMFAIALLVFFYGVVRYILAAGSDEGKELGKKTMIGGIIALFVIASVWGIVSFIGSALGIQQGQQINQVPGVGDRDGGN